MLGDNKTCQPYYYYSNPKKTTLPYFFYFVSFDRFHYSEKAPPPPTHTHVCAHMWIFLSVFEGGLGIKDVFISGLYLIVLLIP